MVLNKSILFKIVHKLTYWRTALDILMNSNKIINIHSKRYIYIENSMQHYIMNNKSYCFHKYWKSDTNVSKNGNNKLVIYCFMGLHP